MDFYSSLFSGEPCLLLRSKTCYTLQTNVLTGEMCLQRKAMIKRKKRTKKGEPQTITKAVTHIRLEATNPGKLTALDQLSEVYTALTQQYVTLFCTDELPNGFRAPCFLTFLSERWHRVAIQHSAGIAKSWRSNRANASQDYLDALAEYRDQETDGTLEAGTKEPQWRE